MFFVSAYKIIVIKENFAVFPTLDLRALQADFINKPKSKVKTNIPMIINPNQIVIIAPKSESLPKTPLYNI